MTHQIASTHRTRRMPSFPRREFAVTALMWCAVGLVAAALRLLAMRAIGSTPTIAGAFMDLWTIALWAVATPFILRSARRIPVRPPKAATNAMFHMAIGTAFVVGTNVIIRLPLLAHAGWSALVASTMLGVATYYPTAIISYGVLVALGHRAFAATTAVVSDAANDVDAPAPDDSRLVIREWNRVHLIEPDDIEWIEADNNHVVVHTASRAYKGRERISDVEARLDGRRFVRVHRSALVHVAKIREVQPLMRGDQAIVLHSGRVVRVARSRRHALEDALGVAL